MSKAAIKRAIKGSAIGRVLLIPYRYWIASKPVSRQWLRVFPWLIRSKETVNFTYELTDLSKETLAAFVAEVAGCEPASVREYIKELDDDAGLREHVSVATARGPMVGVSDKAVRPGKRTAYYALVRALKPKLIVEAGVDKGLGTVIMASALLRNTHEGSPGRLIGLDVSHDAGFLIGSPYDAVAEVRIGDAIQTIRDMDEPVDVFVQDINPGIEGALLEALEPNLSASGVALSVWHSGALMRFAERTGRRFAIFVEETKDHWYPGAKIPAAYGRTSDVPKRSG